VAEGFNQAGSKLGVVAIDLDQVLSATAEGWQIYPRLPGEAGLPYYYSIWQQEVSVGLPEHSTGGDFGVRAMMRLPELEARLDVLTTEILLPLQASKVVDSEAINRLYELADDLAAEIGCSDAVPRLLTGKLWFVFTQMLSEADHTRSPDDILMSAWAYESRLEKIFGPFFSSPPTPGVPRY